MNEGSATAGANNQHQHSPLEVSKLTGCWRAWLRIISCDTSNTSASALHTATDVATLVAAEFDMFLSKDKFFPKRKNKKQPLIFNKQQPFCLQLSLSRFIINNHCRLIINNYSAAADKIRKYRADYNNRPPSVVSLIPAIVSTSGHLHSEFVRILFLHAHRETDRFFTDSGVQLPQTHPGDQFTFRLAAFLTQLQNKVGLTLPKSTALRININLDGSPIASKSHTHPSYSQTSRLLTSSLSLGIPVPRPTQCVRGV